MEDCSDELDLAELSFGHATPANTGRPGHHSATLLKPYLHGYLNRMPSNRSLKREAQRNLEVLWLTARLAADFKTIADFCRDNGPALQATCRRFVLRHSSGARAWRATTYKPTTSRKIARETGAGSGC